jgi:threonine dehydrogenase-like Zn-dependent dehydrogenase
VNRTFHESIALVRSGVIQVEPLISHRLPLADFAAGLELAEHDAHRMKVQYVIGGAEG